jgi:hypothetical protein
MDSQLQLALERLGKVVKRHSVTPCGDCAMISMFEYHQLAPRPGLTVPRGAFDTIDGLKPPRVSGDWHVR